MFQSRFIFSDLQTHNVDLHQHRTREQSGHTMNVADLPEPHSVQNGLNLS